MSTQREKELARMRAERQVARLKAEAAQRRRRNALLAGGLALVLILAAVVVGVTTLRGRGDTTAIATPAASGTCTWKATAQPASRPVQKPPTEPGRTPLSATLATDRGTIDLSLLTTAAPCASTSLESLAGQGFYDGTTCHRLTTSGIFVLQCGDPTGTGTGGPGYQFAEENLSGATYPRGTVAMAKGSAPGTSGSQFFLVYKDSPLPADYTPFGRITSGLGVIDTVAAQGARPQGDGKPVLPITIATLRTAAGAAAPSAGPGPNSGSGAPSGPPAATPTPLGR